MFYREPCRVERYCSSARNLPEVCYLVVSSRSRRRRPSEFEQQFSQYCARVMQTCRSIGSGKSAAAWTSRSSILGLMATPWVLRPFCREASAASLVRSCSLRASGLLIFAVLVVVRSLDASCLKGTRCDEVLCFMLASGDEGPQSGR